jgi:outer membrane receptor for ferrienterochelin and colicins
MNTDPRRRGATRPTGPALAAAALFASVALAPAAAAQDTTRVVVAPGIRVEAVRSDRRIEDVPIRIELVGREEIEEKMLMTPGSIAMLLNESAGLRVQEVAPSLGGANLRIQGLRGRYTQVLADGLPLYGGQTGALGLLQIPPMDLRQIEVIKGAASALYGGSALGGVVNLVSRRPDGEREALLNATTRGGTDAVLWLAGDAESPIGWTLLAGAHAQPRTDIDGDGWADVPRHRRLGARPRLFVEGERGSLMLTAGALDETRAGGGRVPAGTEHARGLETGRLDAGATGRLLAGGRLLLTARASGMRASHEHRFGTTRERDTHATAFAEATAATTAGAHTLLLGAALQHDRYTARDIDGFDFRHTVASLFAQDELDAGPLGLTASARLDRHSRDGTVLSPRLAAILHLTDDWSLRASAGTGWFAPTPFTDETEEVGLARTLPLADVRPERARSASIDLTGEVGAAELIATLFGSRVTDAITAIEDPARAALRLTNTAGPTHTWGTELVARVEAEPFVLAASHTWLNATEPAPDGTGRRDVPLTPRHAIGIVGMWEDHDTGRLGIELYYTGRQPLDDDPYRAHAVPHVIIGALVERRFGPVRAFLNLENLTDRRQTRWSRLVRPAPTPSGRWTTDAWAPLDGRVVNGGLRLSF